MARLRDFDNRLVYEGHWWQPGGESHKLPGRLTIRPGLASSLLLSGHFPVGGDDREGAFDQAWEEDVVEEGRTYHGNAFGAGTYRSVTLFGPRFSNVTLGYGAAEGAFRIGAAVPIVLVGAHIGDIRESVVESISLRLDTLVLWSRAAPFAGQDRTGQKTADEAAVSAKQEVLATAKCSRMGAEAVVQTKMRREGTMTSRQLVVEPEVVLRYDQPTSVEVVRGHATLLQRLLVVITGLGAAVVNARIGLHQHPDDWAELWLESPLPWDGEAARADRPLVTLDQVINGPGLGALLDAWSALYDRARGPIALLVDNMVQSERSPSRYPDSAFLALARALEGLDRELVGGGDPASTSNEPPVTENVPAGPEECYAENDRNFRKMVSETVGRAGGAAQYILGDEKKRRFANSVVNARNDYTHMNPATESVTDARLGRLSAQLRALLVANVLRAIGVNDAVLTAAFRQHALTRAVARGLARDKN